MEQNCAGRFQNGAGDSPAACVSDPSGAALNYIGSLNQPILKCSFQYFASSNMLLVFFLLPVFFASSSGGFKMEQNGAELRWVVSKRCRGFGSKIQRSINEKHIDNVSVAEAWIKHDCRFQQITMAELASLLFAAGLGF